jgi:hypothetical protein
MMLIHVVVFICARCSAFPFRIIVLWRFVTLAYNFICGGCDDFKTHGFSYTPISNAVCNVVVIGCA